MIRKDKAVVNLIQLPAFSPQTLTMISPSAPAEIPAYYVFATEGYTMLVYDGGRDDHQVYLHSHVRLFNPFPYDRPIGFTAYVHRIVQYQQNFVVLSVVPKHLPHHEVLLAVLGRPQF